MPQDYDEARQAFVACLHDPAKSWGEEAADEKDAGRRNAIEAVGPVQKLFGYRGAMLYLDVVDTLGKLVQEGSDDEQTTRIVEQW